MMINTPLTLFLLNLYLLYKYTVCNIITCKAQANNLSKFLSIRTGGLLAYTKHDNTAITTTTPNAEHTVCGTL